MKKFAKMSLVAAVAVAGLTSYASASSLEEAIKDTKITGYLRQRFTTDHEGKNLTKMDEETISQTKIVVKTTTKVNDNVSAVVKFVKELNAATDSVPMQMGYFVYANGPLTVAAGRTNLVSLLTDNGNPGDGAYATYAAGPVTLAGAYYTSVLDLGNGYDDVYGLGIIGSVEMVNFQGWYLDMYGSDVSAYALQADAKFGPVGVSATYSAKDNNLVKDDVTWLALGATADLGVVTLAADYLATGDDNSDTGLAYSPAIDGDEDSGVNVGSFFTDFFEVPELSAYHVGVSGNVLPNVNLSLDYFGGEFKSTNADYSEINLTAKHKMSKNFTVTGIYGQGEADNADFAGSRIELMYTF